MPYLIGRVLPMGCGCLVKYSIYTDANAIQEGFPDSPFNLKKDIKDIDTEDLNVIFETIPNMLKAHGINSPPSIAREYLTEDRRVAWLKIRIEDEVRKKGKSNGYRCIALVDISNCRIFPLHLYRHSHGESDNISKAASNQLRKIVDEYNSNI